MGVESDAIRQLAFPLPANPWQLTNRYFDQPISTYVKSNAWSYNENIYYSARSI